MSRRKTRNDSKRKDLRDRLRELRKIARNDPELGNSKNANLALKLREDAGRINYVVVLDGISNLFPGSQDPKHPLYEEPTDVANVLKDIRVISGEDSYENVKKGERKRR